MFTRTEYNEFRTCGVYRLVICIKTCPLFFLFVFYNFILTYFIENESCMYGGHHNVTFDLTSKQWRYVVFT